jgi:hypothetical protein
VTFTSTTELYPSQIQHAAKMSSPFSSRVDKFIEGISSYPSNPKMGSDLFFENLNNLPSPKLNYSFFSLAKFSWFAFFFFFSPKRTKNVCFSFGFRSWQIQTLFFRINLQISLVNSSMKFELLNFHIWFIAKFG